MTQQTPFIIDTDTIADWAVRKIREEQEELSRLESLAEQRKAELDMQIEQARKRYEDNTVNLKSALQQYFNTVPHKKTKTQEKYRLLSGTLVFKYGAVDYQRDDLALADWMSQNGYEDLVTIKAAPQWGAFKRLLRGDPHTGLVTMAETGEIVEGLKAVQKDDTFDIKF